MAIHMQRPLARPSPFKGWVGHSSPARLYGNQRQGCGCCDVSLKLELQYTVMKKLSMYSCRESIHPPVHAKFAVKANALLPVNRPILRSDRGRRL